MASQLRVNLGLQQILNAFHQRSIVRHFTHFRVRRFQGQLRTQLIGDEVDLRIFKIRCAQLINIGGELFKFKGSVGGFHGVRRTIRNTTFCIRRAWIDHKHTDLRPFFLICQQFGKVRLCRIGNTDHSFGLIVD